MFSRAWWMIEKTQHKGYLPGSDALKRKVHRVKWRHKKDTIKGYL
jgi:hypothetical protein